jgi:stage II sporulation protein Q
MDENKNVNASTENHETEKEELSQEPFGDTAGKARRLLSKRWVYPAIYLGAAALIIGLMYIKSQVGSAPVSTGSVDEGIQTGTTSAQTTQEWVWPAANGVQTTVSMGFFPDKGDPKQQAAALVNYDNAYYPHQGIDIKAQNGQAFDVVAAVGGKVTAVDSNPLYGKTVEVQAANGYTVRYESLSQTNVKVGETVQAGQVIGRTGTCEFESGQGNHLFFQVLKDGKPVDPQSLVSPSSAENPR